MGIAAVAFSWDITIVLSFFSWTIFVHYTLSLINFLPRIIWVEDFAHRFHISFLYHETQRHGHVILMSFFCGNYAFFSYIILKFGFHSEMSIDADWNILKHFNVYDCMILGQKSEGFSFSDSIVICHILYLCTLFIQL